MKRLALAPMDGWTDYALRKVFKEYSVHNIDLYFTEFAHVQAIKADATERILQQPKENLESEKEIAQLFGHTPEVYREVIPKVLSYGYMGIDLNFGCSVKKIMKNNDGSALIGEYSLVEEIIKACKVELQKYSEKNQLNLSLSVKTRLGINEDISDEWIYFLLEQGIDWVTVHFRTASEGFSGKANWEDNKLVKSSRFNMISEKIIGNGDLFSYDEGLELSKSLDLMGFMMGREAQNLLSKKLEDRLKVLEKYLQYHKKYMLPYYPDEKYSYNTTKKISMWLLKGYHGIKSLKMDLRQCTSYPNLSTIIE